jgi:hypothetical protein
MNIPIIGSIQLVIIATPTKMVVLAGGGVVGAAAGGSGGGFGISGTTILPPQVGHKDCLPAILTEASIC